MERRDFESDDTAQDSLQRGDAALGCPELELGVSGGLDPKEQLLSPRNDLESSDALLMAAVQSFSHA